MGKKTKRTKSIQDALPKQQVKFCECYALSGNGADAYFKAYPASRKHPPRYRAEKASKLLAKANIRAHIASLKDKVAEIAEKKFAITAENVLQELAAIAFASADSYFSWGTREVPIMNRKTGGPVTDEAGKIQMKIEPYAYIKASDSLTTVQKKAIVGAEMTFSKDGMPMVSVKMADKRAALVDLGKHLKLFGADKVAKGEVELPGGGKFTIIVSEAEAKL